MSNQMIKRVANVIVSEYNSSPDAIAKAVILAMREPTEEMLKNYSYMGAELDWKEMIDAALKE